MGKIFSIVGAGFFLLLPLTGLAKIEILNPTIVTTERPQQPTAIRLTLKNSSDAKVSLVLLESDQARLEMHGVKNGKMLSVNEIAIPSKGETALKYGGLHLMVFESPKAILKDSEFPFKLFFDNGEVIEVKAKAISPEEVKRH